MAAPPGTAQRDLRPRSTADRRPTSEVLPALRRSAPLLLPPPDDHGVLVVTATAHPTTTVSPAADMTSGARPRRARWERESGRPVRVFVAAAGEIRGWRPEMASTVWTSLGDWAATQDIAVRFVRATSRSTADVVV